MKQADTKLHAVEDYADKFVFGSSDTVYRYVEDVFREAIRTLRERNGERVGQEIKRQIAIASDSMALEILEGRGGEVAARQSAACYAAWCEASDLTQTSVME